jgi:hypothetical protein
MKIITKFTKIMPEVVYITELPISAFTAISVKSVSKNK